MYAQNEANALMAKLEVQDGASLATLPPDFMGLSYESAQLANPAFLPRRVPR